MICSYGYSLETIGILKNIQNNKKVRLELHSPSIKSESVHRALVLICAFKASQVGFRTTWTKILHKEVSEDQQHGHHLEA